MDGTGLVARIEAYVREVMGRQSPAMAVAHDFKHVDRVRNWALLFAREERYPDLEVLEITALLHDIGLGHVSGPEAERAHVDLPPHGPLGAQIAAEFLKANSNLGRETIQLIADAIRHHSDAPFTVGEHMNSTVDGGALLKILRDADMTDAMGAAGLMRAMTSKSFLPEYDPANIKGAPWGLSAAEFRATLGVEPANKRGPVRTIIDQINRQIWYYDGLHTAAARRIAAPLVEFMKHYVLQLESELAMPKSNRPAA